MDKEDILELLQQPRISTFVLQSQHRYMGQVGAPELLPIDAGVDINRRTTRVPLSASAHRQTDVRRRYDEYYHGG